MLATCHQLTPQQKINKAQRLYEEGLKLADLTPLDDDYTEAVTWKCKALFDEAIALCPSLAEAYCQRGLAYTILAKDRRDHPCHGLALKDYNKAIKLNPDFELAYCVRARLVQQYDEQSFRDLSHCERLNPKRIYYAFLEGRYRLMNGQVRLSAVAYLKSLRKAKPKFTGYEGFAFEILLENGFKQFFSYEDFLIYVERDYALANYFSVISAVEKLWQDYPITVMF